MKIDIHVKVDRNRLTGCYDPEVILLISLWPVSDGNNLNYIPCLDQQCHVTLLPIQKHITFRGQRNLITI